MGISMIVCLTASLPSTSHKTTSVKYACYAHVCARAMHVCVPVSKCVYLCAYVCVYKTGLHGLDPWGKWIMFDRLAVLRPSIHTC